MLLCTYEHHHTEGVSHYWDCLDNGEFVYCMMSLRKTRNGFIVEGVLDYTATHDDIDAASCVPTVLKRAPFETTLDVVRLCGPAPETLHVGDLTSTIRFLTTDVASETRFMRAGRGFLHHHLKRFLADPLKFVYTRKVEVRHKDKKGRRRGNYGEKGRDCACSDSYDW